MGRAREAPGLEGHHGALARAVPHPIPDSKRQPLRHSDGFGREEPPLDSLVSERADFEAAGTGTDVELLLWAWSDGTSCIDSPA